LGEVDRLDEDGARVRLAQRQLPLLEPGQKALDRVRLGYELWRQFNGFPPTVATTEPRAGSSYGGSR